MSVGRSHTPTGPREPFTGRAGVLAARSWLAARGLYVAGDARWSVDIAIGTSNQAVRITSYDLDTRFDLHIRNDEWSFSFSHGSRSSTIRVTDIPTTMGRDDHGLLAHTPALRDIGRLVRMVEQRYHVFFHRAQACIESSIPGAEPMVRAWLASL